MKKFYNRVIFDFYNSSFVFSLRTRVLMMIYLLVVSFFAFCVNEFYKGSFDNRILPYLEFVMLGLVAMPALVYFPILIYDTLFDFVKGKAKDKPKRKLQKIVDDYSRTIMFALLYVCWAVLLMSVFVIVRFQPMVP